MSLIQINDLLSEKEKLQEESNTKKGVAIGIDLGTSNSVVTYYNDNDIIEVIGDGYGELIPSAVFYDDDQILVGNEALNQSNKSFVFTSIKRFMGQSKQDILNQDCLYQYDQTSDDLRFLNQRGEYVSPEDISTEILTYIKKLAEQKLKVQVTEAVITVPAYFDEKQRIATKNSASKAGLNVLRLINEPTSAALAYGLDNIEDISSQGIYLVYDLGGGTFDISILHLQKGVFKVLSTLGDTKLGGDDIDNIIFTEIKICLNIVSDMSTEEKSRLINLAKNIKEELSNQESVVKDIIFQGKTFKFSLSRKSFEEKIKGIIKTTIDMCLIAVSDAKVSIKDIKGIVLVGGSTKIPYIHKQIKDTFNLESLSNINPDKVVSIGAGHKAAELSGKTKNSLLLDVIPLSLGVETAGGIVEKIIHRNTLIPITKKQIFTTYKDNQTAMSIHILQGERELVKDLRSLGKFSLKGIPPMIAGLARIEVSFSIDADGLLKVEALEKTTNISQSIEIKPSWGLNFDSMRNLIEEGFENSEIDIKNRLLAESKVEAHRVIDSLKVALIDDQDLVSKEYKKEIEEELNKLISSLNSEDRDIIEENIKNLDKVTSKFAEDRMNKKVNEALKGKSIEDIEKNIVS